MLGLGLRLNKNNIIKKIRLKNEIIYNPSIWSDWSKTNAAGDSTGISFSMVSGQNSKITIGTNFKTTTKYGLLFKIVSNTMATNSMYAMFCANVTIPTAIAASETGNKKFMVTTLGTIPWNMFQIDTNSSGGTGSVKIKDIRVFELPPGSQQETDFTNMTANQLEAKYPF